MRIDKLLWFLRLAKTRSAAHDWVLTGHLRRNGARVEKPAQAVAPGDVLTLPLVHGADLLGLRVIRILALPTRRGPAAEAQSCYLVLDEVAPSPLAAHSSCSASKGDLQP